MRGIVGALVGTVVTNQLSGIIEAAGAGTIRRLLSKQEMQFMAAWNLGPRWKAMAESPVLFWYDDKTGEVRWPWPEQNDDKVLQK